MVENTIKRFIMFSNELHQKIWIRLSTRSRRAITRIKKKFGHRYYYTPRSHLVVNLAKEFGVDNFTIANSLMEMRGEIEREFRQNSF